MVGSMPYWARVLIGRANRLSPSPGFTEEDMMIVWERCEGRCAGSGLEFSETRRWYRASEEALRSEPRPDRQVGRL